MKPLILSTSDLEGGAARAAYRLHQGLQQIGVGSRMLVQTKLSDDAAVIAPQSRLAEAFSRTRISVENSLRNQLYPRRQKTTFSAQWLPDRIAAKVARLQPDLLNLHWVNQAFMSIETAAKLRLPLVWTLHDMWAFTGGCHYTGECDRYQTACGKCPQLQSQATYDLSRWIWQRKSKAWRQLDLTVVALSAWMAQCVQSSTLFKEVPIAHIPNGLNTQHYQPIEPELARKVLGLPTDKLLILSGSLNAVSDQRKGFHLLHPALISLSQAGWQDRAELVIFGASRPQQPPELGFKTHYLGTLHDDYSLAMVYSAADVFVAPSLQDNLPNTVMEAIACGTPCVAFEIGGMPDLIEHQKNGYLAQPFEVDQLAQGIAWTLEHEERRSKLAYRAREKVEQEFTLELQAQRYAALFEEKLAAHRKFTN